jgi:hypothetical protein
MNSAGFIKILVVSLIKTGSENLVKSFPIRSLNNFKNIVSFTSTGSFIDTLILSGVDITITSGVVNLTNPLGAPNLVYNTGSGSTPVPHDNTRTARVVTHNELFDQTSAVNKDLNEILIERERCKRDGDMC